ncbi:hypothetical protein V495_08023 [Pseudogymnoascus sp. VKM F-4514 (FW-929)]|nr:hypothetical protein V495_08023 [Pseudogymnoascus sp. VKM F-4514 (FW-929)]
MKFFKAIGPLLGGLEMWAARGVEANHKLTPEEWKALVEDEGGEKFKAQEKREDAEYEGSFPVLRKKELEKRNPLVGDKPVYVIGGTRSWDGKHLYKAAVAKGNGTEEQRRVAWEAIEGADEENDRLIGEHLRLSTRGKLVFARESGHFVQLTEPEIVVDGVKWVLDELKASS